jgi:hypothetical protein
MAAAPTYPELRAASDAAAASIDPRRPRLTDVPSNRRVGRNEAGLGVCYRDFIPAGWMPFATSTRMLKAGFVELSDAEAAAVCLAHLPLVELRLSGDHDHYVDGGNFAGAARVEAQLLKLRKFRRRLEIIAPAARMHAAVAEEKARPSLDEKLAEARAPRASNLSQPAYATYALTSKEDTAMTETAPTTKAARAARVAELRAEKAARPATPEAPALAERRRLQREATKARKAAAKAETAPRDKPLLGGPSISEAIVAAGAALTMPGETPAEKKARGAANNARRAAAAGEPKPARVVGTFGRRAGHYIAVGPTGADLLATAPTFVPVPGLDGLGWEPAKEAARAAVRDAGAGQQALVLMRREGTGVLDVRNGGRAEAGKLDPNGDRITIEYAVTSEQVAKLDARRKPVAAS